MKLDLMLWGTNSMGFHLTATTLFALNAVMIFLILDLLLPGRRAFAVLGGWLVAIHPVFSEIVPMITFREETLASLCILVSFYTFLRHRIKNRSPLGFWVFFVLALLTKESAISSISLAMGYDLVQAVVRRERSDAVMRRARLYLPFVPIILAYFALRWIAFGGILGNPHTGYLSLRNLFLFHKTFFYDFLFHETMFGFSDIPWVRLLAVVLVGTGLVLVVRRRDRVERDQLALLVFLGPLWYIGATSILYGVYFSARHNVTPVIGILLFLTVLLAVLSRALGLRRDVPVVAVAVLLGTICFVPIDVALSRDHDVAARDVQDVRARIEAETLDVPDGGTVLLNNVPVLANRPYYFGWGLQSALKRPFTANDLANRVLVINHEDIQLNEYDFTIPAKFDRVVIFEQSWPRARPWDFVYKFE